tara:strand:+ start:401 stop:625 length:225 start_codon:yes stop_codon:yes gene_type:complete
MIDKIYTEEDHKYFLEIGYSWRAKNFHITYDKLESISHDVLVHYGGGLTPISSLREEKETESFIAGIEKYDTEK